MEPSWGPAMQPGMAPSNTQDKGCHPVKPNYPSTTDNSPKCQCEGAKLDAAGLTAFRAPSDESENGGGLAFGGLTVLRKSSLTESGYHVNEFPMLRSGCAGNLDYGDYENNTWPERYTSYEELSGRDTFGLPVILQGNTGILNTENGGYCHGNLSCDKYCGKDTGCNPACALNHPAVGAGKYPAGSQRSLGIHVCSNEYVNMIVTFLMEVLGILVFFSICTITFWITLGYYIVQLLIDLKNADRNVHVAVGVVLSLLVLAFAITLVTHIDGSCRNRVQAIRKGIESSATTSASSCKKCTKSATAAAKRSCAMKCKMSSKPKLKPTPTKSQKCPMLSVKPQPPKATPKATPCQKSKTLKKPKNSRGYTDCQGRAIFNRSRRNSILIEMKQPPTWIIWLREQANEFFNRQ
ncbi:hypothetical protein ACLKA7_006583 [Drosophila subpalustris]